MMEARSTEGVKRSWPKRLAIGVLAGAGVTAMYGLLLFGCAGRIDLPVYWAYLTVAGTLSIVGFITIDPDLLRERRKPGPGGKDAWMIQPAKLLLTAHLVIAPLDVGRFHFSDTVPVWAQWAGLVVFAFGLGLTFACMAVNRWFSSVVRIQTDRGHQLITTGPYAIVRHPGYTGVLLLSVGSGLALGSWWGAVPVGLFALLILHRCVFEDRFLLREFEGYGNYADRVRYRLVPGVW